MDFIFFKVEDNYCRLPSKSLVWRKDSDIEERGITTRELIVEQDFMIQFKVSFEINLRLVQN